MSVPRHIFDQWLPSGGQTSTDGFFKRIKKKGETKTNLRQNNLNLAEKNLGLSEVWFKTLRIVAQRVKCPAPLSLFLHTRAHTHTHTHLSLIHI